MKLGLNATGVLAIAAIAGVAALILWNRKAIGAAVEAVNPASQNNIVNRGVSAVGAAVTGDASWSLGGQLAEWFDPSVAAANASLARKPVPAVDQTILDRWDSLLMRPISQPVWAPVDSTGTGYGDNVGYPSP